MAIMMPPRTRFIVRLDTEFIVILPLNLISKNRNRAPRQTWAARQISVGFPIPAVFWKRSLRRYYPDQVPAKRQWV